MKCFLIALTMIGLMSLSLPNTSAEEKMIDATGFCIENESIDCSVESLKEQAKQSAMRHAVEKAGVYVESLSKVENMELTQDEILIISGKITQLQSIDYKMDMTENNLIRCTALVRVLVDTADIQAKLDEEKQRIMELKNDNDDIRAHKDQIIGENKRINSSRATDLNELYSQLINENTTSDEKLSLTEQIMFLNPVFKKGITYALRAKILSEQGRFAEALECDLKYVELNSDNPHAYFVCALDYCNLSDWDNAAKYINKAIELEPENILYLKQRKLIKDVLNG